MIKMKHILTLVLTLASTLGISAQTMVDTHIAVSDQQDSTTFVLIISNENYKYELPVPYALNDGEIFKLYCEKMLGIPSVNIHYTPDATLNDIQMQLAWLEQTMETNEGEARAIVYYSGHGMNDGSARQSYLLPVDGKCLSDSCRLSTQQLYQQLGAMPSKGTIVFLDTSFGGTSHDGQMLSSSRGVALKAKEESVRGNMVVFSAAKSDETARPYKEGQHSLFTYHILSAMQENGGNMSLGELSDRVTKEVTRASLIENGKSQTPTVTASSESADWRDWKLSETATNRKEKGTNEQEPAKPKR